MRTPGGPRKDEEVYVYSKRRTMADWKTAVSSGDAKSLVDITLSLVNSPAEALSLLRSCVSLCEQQIKTSPSQLLSGQATGERFAWYPTCS